MWLFIHRSTFGILRVIRVYFYQLFFWSPCIFSLTKIYRLEKYRIAIIFNIYLREQRKNVDIYFRSTTVRRRWAYRTKFTKNLCIEIWQYENNWRISQRRPVPESDENHRWKLAAPIIQSDGSPITREICWWFGNNHPDVNKSSNQWKCTKSDQRNWKQHKNFNKYRKKSKRNESYCCYQK